MSSDSAETLLPQGPNGEITLSSKDFSMPSTRVHDESQDRYDDPVAHQHRRDESFTRTDSGRPAEHSEDGESSASSDDSEDRALERELWDEESNVGTIKKKKTTILQSLGRDRSSQQRYSAVGGSRSGRSSRSEDNEDHMNSLGTSWDNLREKAREKADMARAKAGGFRFPGAGSAGSSGGAYTEKNTSHLRKLSLNESNPGGPALLNNGAPGGGLQLLPQQKSRHRARCAWIVCAILFGLILVVVAGTLIAAAVKGDGDVTAGFRNMTDEAAQAAGLPVTGTDENGRTLYSKPFDGGKETSSSALSSGATASASASGSAPSDASSTSAHTTTSRSDGKYTPSANDGKYTPSTAPSGSAFPEPASSPVTSQNSANSQPSPTASASTNGNTWQGHTLGGSDSSAEAGGHTLSAVASSSALSKSPSSSVPSWQTQPGDAAGQWSAWSEAPVMSMLSTATTGVMSQVPWASQSAAVAQTTSWQTLPMGNGAASILPATATTGTPVWAPLPTIAAPLAVGAAAGTYSTTNFSMATAPESFQTYKGPASLFHSNGQLGPCGISGNDTDYLVALPSSLYMSSLRPGSTVESTYCGSKVLVTSGKDGRTVTATVSGACTQCSDEQSLALSVAMYQALDFDMRTKDAPPTLLWGFVGDNKLANSAATTVVTSAAAAKTTGSHDDEDKDGDSWFGW